MLKTKTTRLKWNATRRVIASRIPGQLGLINCSKHRCLIAQKSMTSQIETISVKIKEKYSVSYLQTCLVFVNSALFTDLPRSEFHGTKDASTKINNRVKICKYGSPYSNARIRHSTVFYPAYLDILKRRWQDNLNIKRKLKKGAFLFELIQLTTSRPAFESKPNARQNSLQPIICADPELLTNQKWERLLQMACFMF